MARIAAILFLVILIVSSFAGAEEAATSKAYWDWLGSGPIYGYGGILSPNYYPYYYPYYPDEGYVSPGYTWPKYIDSFWIYPPTNPRWIGTHWDLPKALAIARSGSSIRVYYHGFWQTP